MGMFDYVNFKVKCPTCGMTVKGFQSKDKECTMDTLEYWEVDNFYAMCENCETWVEYRRIKPANYAPLSDYELTYYKLGEPNV